MEDKKEVGRLSLGQGKAMLKGGNKKNEEHTISGFGWFLGRAYLWLNSTEKFARS